MALRVPQRWCPIPCDIHFFAQNKLKKKRKRKKHAPTCKKPNGKLVQVVSEKQHTTNFKKKKAIFANRAWEASKSGKKNQSLSSKRAVANMVIKEVHVSSFIDCRSRAWNHSKQPTGVSTDLNILCNPYIANTAKHG